MNISIVIPIFNEEESIRQLYREIVLKLENYKEKFEIIFVDDASEDFSVREIEFLEKRDSKVHLYKHQINSKKSAALLTGINKSQYEYIVTLDGDLQNDPADIIKVVNLMNSRVDLVCGIRKFRNDPNSKRAPSLLGNYLLRLIFKYSCRDIGCGLKIFRKNCILSLGFAGDVHRYLPILFHIHNYQVATVDVNHRARVFGKSKYGFFRIYFVLRDIFKLLAYRKRIITV
jgi:glycosyltransferase involved in cell wall biosynthesis